MDHQVRTADGGRLQVLELGVPDGRPVLVHGGTPGSRLMYEPSARLTKETLL
jgi:hypothetical protein